LVYTELHTHSHYSLLDGASSPAELVKRAAALGMAALALTDHDNVYGAVEFMQAAQVVGIRPILGAELTLADETHLTLLVRDAVGWANLCTLITLAQHNAPKGQALLPLDTLEGHAASFAVLVYHSAWLRHYHPVAFTAALLNNQPMGFYTPAVLFGDIDTPSCSFHIVAPSLVMDKRK
jgi:DNA polymerase III alpha subunit